MLASGILGQWHHHPSGHVTAEAMAVVVVGHPDALPCPPGLTQEWCSIVMKTAGDRARILTQVPVCLLLAMRVPLGQVLSLPVHHLPHR